MFKVPEKFRVDGPAGEKIGAFLLPNSVVFAGLLLGHSAFQHDYYCIASNCAGWEHVSVSFRGSKVYPKPENRASRLPSWEAMQAIKLIFWDEEDAVVQYHPPKSEYVNNGDVLHLWRPIGKKMLRPHYHLVGTLPMQTMEEALSEYLYDHTLQILGHILLAVAEYNSVMQCTDAQQIALAKAVEVLSKNRRDGVKLTQREALAAVQPYTDEIVTLAGQRQAHIILSALTFDAPLEDKEQSNEDNTRVKAKRRL